jgi:putative dimethyl sulfoxide reductase chaperone
LRSRKRRTDRLFEEKRMLHGLEVETVRPVAVLPPARADVTAHECRERAQTYRLFSGVFLEEPRVEFLEALRAPETLAVLRDAGAVFDADFTTSAPEALAETLACEFTTMFVASGGFPAVESVRLNGRYQQEPHHAVKQTYREAGFAIEGGRFKVFEDQLGVELAFVAELLERAAAALDAGCDADSRRLDREIKRFWAQHLGKWVRGYMRLVERATEHSFYREMAKLLRGFADEEIARLRLHIEDEDQARAVVPKSEVKVLFNPDEPVCNACGTGG